MRKYLLCAAALMLPLFSLPAKAALSPRTLSTMGERVMSSDLGGALTVEHSVGFAGKYLRSTLPNSDGREVSATAYAADAGYLARMPSLGVDVGVALLNMGGQIKYLDAEEDLPAILRAGVAYDNVRFWRSRMLNGSAPCARVQR